MVLLFLLSLLLAWPTYGLSILAYIVLVIVKGYILARSRMHYVNQTRAIKKIAAGEQYVPSWADKNIEGEIFIESVIKLAVRNGVDPNFIRQLFEDREIAGLLVFLAGAMEQEGATFQEQQLAVADKVQEFWTRAGN